MPDRLVQGGIAVRLPPTPRSPALGVLYRYPGLDTDAPPAPEPPSWEPPASTGERTGRIPCCLCGSRPAPAPAVTPPPVVQAPAPEQRRVLRICLPCLLFWALVLLLLLLPGGGSRRA